MGRIGACLHQRGAGLDRPVSVLEHQGQACHPSQTTNPWVAASLAPSSRVATPRPPPGGHTSGMARPRSARVRRPQASRNPARHRFLNTSGIGRPPRPASRPGSASTKAIAQSGRPGGRPTALLPAPIHADPNKMLMAAKTLAQGPAGKVCARCCGKGCGWAALGSGKQTRAGSGPEWGLAWRWNGWMGPTSSCIDHAP